MLDFPQLNHKLTQTDETVVFPHHSLAELYKISFLCCVLQVGSFKREMTFTFQPEDLRRESSKKTSHHLFPLAMEEDMKAADTKKANRILDQEKENTRSICLLEQKRKVVSSNIDVPPVR